jgi:hypothetical protein
MGPNNPWSPSWRPDERGDRRAVIKAARRGALLAAIIYVPIGALAPTGDQLPDGLGLRLVLAGMPGVALLGAGLAPAAIGSRIEAIVAGIAFGIGSPVAAVTSLAIAAFVFGTLTAHAGLAGAVLRAGVTAALAVAPIVAVGAASWVVAVRRLSR